MSTRAEDFRYAQERSGPKKAKSAPRHLKRSSGLSFLTRRDRSKSASRRARTVRRGGPR